MDPRLAVAGARGVRTLWPYVAALGAAVYAVILVLAPASSSAAMMPPGAVFSEEEVAEATNCAAADVDLAGGDVLSWAEVAKAAQAAGWTGEDLVTAVAVVQPESSRNPDAYNPAAGGNRGLWQINSVHAELLAAHDWRDPLENARMGFKIYADAGNSFRPWEAYTTGRHEPYLDEARAAVAELGEVAPAQDCTPVGEVDASLTDAGDEPQAANGYRPRAAKGRVIALERWGCEVRSDPCVRTVGGYAYRTIAGTNTLSDHATGRANDIMIPDYASPAGVALGDQIAAFFVANAEALRVKYVIWNDRIWQPGSGWTSYGHPGGGRSDTLQHRDHVHVSYEAGA